MHPFTDGEELPDVKADLAQTSLTRLHTICLMQMSQFMLEPTAAQAIRVSTLLKAIRQHDNHSPPEFGCDPYLRAQSVWVRVAEHIKATRPASEPAMNDAHWIRDR